MKRLVPLALGLCCLILTSCEEPVDTFVEVPANNIGPCWECKELPALNIGNKVLRATTYWGLESYFETFYNYSDGKYTGWVELDYLTGDSISEEYIYNADDLVAVISYDGFERIIDSVRTISTTDTNYVFFQQYEYRFANVESDELPNVVIEYLDDDYIDEYQKFIFYELENNSFEVLNILDGDTFVHQNFKLDNDGRILSFEEYGFDGYSQDYKYVGALKNPYPKPPYPSGLPHNKFFSLDATNANWKVLYNGDAPQMLVDANGANPSDTLFFYYGSPD